MKILVTGAKGQLGYDVIKALRVRGIECQGVDIEDFDITNYSLTEKYIKRYNPYAVIHCSAYTAVDKAEDEAEVCYKVNTIGTENIAKCCRNIDAKMIYISTDYVFSGNGKNFYEIDESIYNEIIKTNTKIRIPVSYLNNLPYSHVAVLLPKNQLNKDVSFVALYFFI